MSTEAAVRFRVDPTNPGQFFACCGLLELADRLWGGAEGWFANDSHAFNLRPVGTPSEAVTREALLETVRSPLVSTMTQEQLDRRDDLAAIPKKERNKGLEEEKAKLDGAYREAPLVLGPPFEIRLDWYRDDRSGGSDVKTWAGQQSAIEVARGMQEAARPIAEGHSCEDCLHSAVASDSPPLNFDSDLGHIGGPRDVGFSFDPLGGITMQVRAFTEFGAFVGLQRFRPLRPSRENRYRYGTWTVPLRPEVAQLAACTLLPTAGTCLGSSGSSTAQSTSRAFCHRNQLEDPMTKDTTLTLEAYDTWLDADTGPAALVLREPLMPVEGHDGVLFPATFAAGDGFPGGYNIDTFPDGANVCLVDTVGSQANRIEPLFTQGEYAGLVPQVVVKAGDKRVNLLSAGHRAGDAIVRCSALKQSLQDAFKAALKGNCVPLAKIAPTSLVFGVWDSRDTQAKLPRLIASTIRAYSVRELTRSAQFVPATDYVQDGLLEEPGDLKDAEGKVKAKHPFARWGFSHVPASASHGGVIATKGVRREATLHIAALRMLAAGEDDEATKTLQRYILGLALTAFTSPPSTYLRQGCNLVANPATPREFVEVYGDGRRVDATVTHTRAMAYAKLVAKAFDISPDRKIDHAVLPDREVDFDTVAAKEELAGDGAAKKASKSRGKPSK